MKKVFSFLVVVATLVAGSAMAQTDTHDVTINIPEVLQISIFDASNNVAVAPSVSFDYVTNAAAYLAMVNAGGGALAATSSSQFADVRVMSNHASWQVTVSAAGALGIGLALADIDVTPSGVTGPNVATAPGWDLTGGVMAVGTATVGGGQLAFQSLGFSGNDYSLTVNGDEDPGTYTLTVTYTITGL